jgi:hypothetical protein
MLRILEKPVTNPRTLYVFFGRDTQGNDGRRRGTHCGTAITQERAPPAPHCG